MKIQRVWEEPMKEMDFELSHGKKDVHVGEKLKAFPNQENGIYISLLGRSQGVDTEVIVFLQL